MKMGVSGIKVHPATLLEEITLTACGMLMKMGVSGMNGHVNMLLEMAILTA
jgi:hypothetical protein